MDPFLGEIRIFAGNFAPTGWALCNGQLLPISQNTALFALLGTFYGGDGKSTFALPNLQDRTPVGTGQGPMTHDHSLGETGGSETVTLLESEIPFHPHTVSASQADGTSQTPANEKLATGVGIGQYAAPNNLTQLSPNVLAPTGGDSPHNNMQPYLTFYYNIALQGVFPPRA